jgi:hypothetical protein
MGGHFYKALNEMNREAMFRALQQGARTMIPNDVNSATESKLDAVRCSRLKVGQA